MRHRTAMTLALTAALLVGAPLSAQEDDVRRDFLATLAAWNAQDAEGFCAGWMPNYQGFYVGTRMLQQNAVCNPAATQAGFDAGHDPSAGGRHLTIKVHGDVAVVACYLEGEIQMNPEEVISGPFRFTATLVKDGDSWKSVQYHFSELHEN